MERKISLSSKSNGLAKPIENVWVKDTDKPNVYIMNNIPANPDLPGLGDEFKYNPSDETFEILKKFSLNKSFNYQIQDCHDDDGITTRYKSIRFHFESRGIFVEGIRFGLVSIAIPINMPYEYYNKVISSCPHLILTENQPSITDNFKEN